LPKSNSTWWAAKLAENQGRDRETDAHMLGLGWSVLRVWEHEDVAKAADLIEVQVEGR
jgi:DNA mismatch endonuclease (patch repair protein)